MSVKKESILVIVSFFVLFFAHTKIQMKEWYHGYGDNAFLAQLLETIAETGLPNTQINTTVYRLFKTLSTDPEVLLKQDFKAPSPVVSNQFRKHTYFITYLVAPLATFVPGNVLLPALKVACFLLLLLFAYYFYVFMGSLELLLAPLFFLYQPIQFGAMALDTKCILIAFLCHWLLFV
ncbi:MAG: hypothetical protein IPK04_06575 [Bdellovibrionales bacterium]|nr:hypothetical protein [Bdellovibrionales bacterium]